MTRQPLEFSQIYDFSVANDRWDVNQGMKKATGWVGFSLSRQGVRPQPTFIIDVGVAITVGVGVTVIDGSLHLSY